LALTALATFGFERWVEARDKSRFDDAVLDTKARIETRIEGHLTLLLATRGLFATDEEVTVTEFRRFASQLEVSGRFHGLLGIGYTARVRDAEAEQFTSKLIEQGQAGFHIWPNTSAADRFTIAFLEPMNRRNRAALGYDMSTEPTRREAMFRARDEGTPAASGRVTLVQEIDPVKQAGVLIYVPVYAGGHLPRTPAARRQELLGFVYSPIRMDDLFKGIFGAEAHPQVAFEVFDGAPVQESLLHRSANLNVGLPLRSGSSTIHVAGRTWTLHFKSQPAFEAASGRRFVPWVLLAGVVGSLLAFFVSRTRSLAREEKALQARVLDSMSEGVSVTDHEGVLLYTNAAGDRMFGYAPGELLGQRVTALTTYPAEHQAALLSRIRADLEGTGHWSGELSNVRKDGTTVFTMVRVSALRVAGGGHLWVWVQLDVTEAKRAESERERLLALEQAARADAEAANRAKDEFLAMLGHELRNPLAPIVTAVELLRMRPDTRFSKELEIIGRQVGHVIRLVEDLLDVSRITRGKVVLKQNPVDLGPIITKAVEIASPLLEQKSHALTLNVAPNLVVLGDETRLAQIFANLLTNAAKFTDPHGHVTLTALGEGEQVVVRVKDDGVGIPAELTSNIFELFVQGQRELARTQGGLGLGLTLVRRLAEAHGGSVAVHSEGAGRGSEFEVRLPAHAGVGEIEALPNRVPTRDRGEASRRVLVVDDNWEAADLLGELLRAAGHDVRVANDGPQAIEAASSFDPEIAVLDIGLPVMDGYELATRLRRRGSQPRLIAVTGYGQEHDRERSLAAGFDQHLVKPVDGAALLAAIATATRPETAPAQ
jgi:PAS domain S-box-containing protein